MTGTEGVKITPAAEQAFGDSAVEIHMKISESMLGAASDSHLAMLWHVLQAAPADFDHKEPGEIAERIGREIIRRWLRNVHPELWHQQGSHYHWKQLTRFAKFDGTEWVLRDEAFQVELERRTPDRDLHPTVSGDPDA